MCPTRLQAAQRREGGNGAHDFIQYETEYGLVNTFALTKTTVSHPAATLL